MEEQKKEILNSKHLKKLTLPLNKTIEKKLLEYGYEKYTTKK